MKKKANILAVDEDTVTLEVCARIGEEIGQVVIPASSCAEALVRAETAALDVAVIQSSIAAAANRYIMKSLKMRFPFVRFIIISSHPSIEEVVSMMKAGAFSYLVKPLSPSVLVKAIFDALDARECWVVEEEGGRSKIGLDTRFLSTLGHMVYVELPVETARKECADVLVKILTEDGMIYSIAAPLSGTVEEVNEEIVSNIDLLRTAPEKGAWLVKLSGGGS